MYDLQYITQGDGKDGRFYNYAPNADGFDYEWTVEVWRRKESEVEEKNEKRKKKEREN